MTYRAVFVHVQKTAGCSIRAAFPDDLVFSAKHARLEQARKNYMLWRSVDDTPWAGLLKFTFVRNPWDRWLEFYIHQYPHSDLTADGFAKFIARQDVPEWDFDEFDFVGQFESLAWDVASVGAAIGSPNPALPHLHPMPDLLDWRPYYDTATRCRVAELGAWEIERFGYTFDDCEVADEVDVSIMDRGATASAQSAA